jgi:hypothetical protein
MAKRIVISGGVVSGFADEVSFDGLEVEQFEKKRVSHVVPENYFLRTLFVSLRAIVSDESTVASWTRTWGCNWVVLIDGEQYGPFVGRDEAISFEKEKIYQQGKLGCQNSTRKEA